MFPRGWEVPYDTKTVILQLCDNGVMRIHLFKNTFVHQISQKRQKVASPALNNLQGNMFTLLHLVIWHVTLLMLS